MRFNKKPTWPRLICGVVLLIVLCPGILRADDSSEFGGWLAELRKEALSKGISSATLDLALSDLKPLPSVLAADRNQPEFKRTLEEYLASAVNERRIREGQELLKKHRRLFGRLSVRYKIPPRILVALWGVETDFGRYQGKIPVIQALATLAHDGRRSDYFRRELFDALRILDAGLIPADRFLGSWAGAMGQLQFMPSTFRNYAIDQSGDGYSDIFANEADVLASAANYLTKSGWETDQTWGREVRLPQDFDRKLLGLDYEARLSHWQKLGVRQINGKPLPKVAMQASLVQPDDEGGRVFLVYHNYRVLRTWNRSHSFAIAVGTLADRILAK